MILQQLYNDADAILKQTTGQGLPPSMYLLKKVRWIIELNDGQPAQFTELAGEGRGGERGLEMLVPNMKRTSGVRPLLFADKTSYVLGLRIPDAKLDANRDLQKYQERALEEFEAFKQLAHECAEATNEPDVQRIVSFLESWDPVNLPEGVPSTLTRDNLITFKVNGKRIVDNPKVQQFWATYGQSAEEDEADAASMQCLISGVRGTVEENMPVPVKGLPGGNSEMAIVSANAPAFESYGLSRAQTSPICRDAGERFGQALNALLTSPNHHVLVQNTTYVYWSPEGTMHLPVFDPKEVKEFLSAVRSGKRWYQYPPDARFYLFGLSPNAARVAVRTAIDTTVAEIEQRQADWFERLSVLGFDDAGRAVMDKSFPLKSLAVAGYRDFKDIEPGVEDMLIRAALTGEALSHTFLNLLVNRCRAERTVTHPRAMLLKYILTQHLTLSEAKTMIDETSVPRPAGLEDDEARAYHLGRLFAELEAIQSQAIPGINAGIADKFYGSASSTPASVFGILLDGVQNHLAKLRKEKEQKGAYHGAQKRLEEILRCVDEFPKTLPLKNQAYFSLGYYHHRAAQRKATTEATAAKKTGQAAVDVSLLDDPAFGQGEDNE